MIVLQRRFSNVIVTETEVSPTIEAGAGEGGNNLPMILVEDDELSKSDRNIISGRTSGELQRTGRIQRYAGEL